MDGNPFKGVTVEYTLQNFNTVVKSGTFTTASDGLFKISYLATVDPMNLKNVSYLTELTLKVSKEDYPSKYEDISCHYGSRHSNHIDSQLQERTIKLTGPIDFLDKNFVTTVSDVPLKEKVLRFVHLIDLQGIISGSVLEKHSVNLVSFKDNSYLQFKFSSVNVYNSLKLNKYDIGKLLFDEVVRKVLNPLNEYISESNLFYGYDLTVEGRTKSFLDKWAAPTPIEFRFMIPKETVRKYKDKDISGQQVLDASIILMDDERIELKLQ